MFATVSLIATCFITPYQLAFYSHFQTEPRSLAVINQIIDIIFVIDIVVSFNTSYFDQKASQFSMSRKAIAWNYIKTWFVIDLVAVLPFEFLIKNYVAQTEMGTGFEGLSKITKIARFYRVLKLFRLVKLSKLAKEKAKLRNTMQSKMHISVAFERLLLFFAVCLIFVHTLACAWVWLAYENELENSESHWIKVFGFNYFSNYDLYITAVYFVVSTITTVGYGDIYATETPERMLGILTMLIGVIAFSFSTGSLSSIV